MDGAGWLWLLTGLAIGALGVGIMSGRGAHAHFAVHFEGADAE